ncbi:hypothetical protein GCM10025771_22180 [Niveibacterium umoris]|uniref:Nif11 domain-containing protein n=1 Tax=Niveibacterium umoris TaxID=1193620 RepID=A0A840BIY4_9RHOO|nr:Nif11-like leader peptide family natural product precursor [Niveibacterium umoris]MBB4012593.1 hypothetical protein [Niveibacterium umoris]
MSTEALSTFLRIARTDPDLLAELRAAADPDGLRVVALATIAARHGHTIDPASLGAPQRRTDAAASAQPGGTRFGDARLYRAEDGELMVRI